MIEIIINFSNGNSVRWKIAGMEFLQGWVQIWKDNDLYIYPSHSIQSIVRINIIIKKGEKNGKKEKI